MKAGIYLRISLDQTGEGLGVARQLEDCTQHANALGWEVAEVYRDNDISATSGKTRPEYRRMLADIDAGELQGVIAWHADRLYRKTTDLGELVDVCKRNNTQISTVRAGNIDLTTPTGRLVAGLLAQVATYEGEAKADRWKRSWRQGREAGRVARTGSRLFGYTRDGHVIEEEAAIARGMAQDVLDGGTLTSIANRLNDEGILTTRGNIWRTHTVKQYLANPRIAAWSTLHHQVVAEGEWTPLLDRETWDEIRSLFSTRTRTYIPRVSLLNGLIYCGACDHRMLTGAGSGGRIYRCGKRPGWDGCGRISGQAEPTEQLVEGFAQERLSDPRVHRRVAELFAQPRAGDASLAELQQRRNELEAQLDEPGVPVESLLRAIDRIKDKEEAALAELAQRPRVPLPVQGGPWPTDLGKRRGLIDLVVAKVTMTPRDDSKARRFDPERVVIQER